MTPRPPAAVGPGTVAVRRITARLLGWVTVLTAPAYGYAAIDQAPAMHWWWNAVAALTVGGACVYIIANAVRGATIRLPAATMGAAQLLVVALWPYGVADQAMTADRLPWVWLSMPLALAAVATLDSIRVSLVYGAAIAAIFSSYRPMAVAGSGDTGLVGVEAVLLATMSTGLALLVRASWSAAGRLDADAARAAKLRTEAARLDAAALARAEVDRVLHDRVLAALNVAVRSPTSSDVPGLARDALAALDSFEDVPRGFGDPRLVTPDELATRLAAAVEVVAPAARVTSELDPRCTVPEAPARALAEATAEAVRNSVRHAAVPGRDLRVDVRLVAGWRSGSPEVSVTVEDDGAGFDPALVAGDRLGLEVSVRGRMRGVQGTSEVHSRPGSGTRVVLAWPHAAGGGTGSAVTAA